MPAHGASVKIVVSGLAALVPERNPELKADEVGTMLTTTARDLGSTGRDDEFGAGGAGCLCGGKGDNRGNARAIGFIETGQGRRKRAGIEGKRAGRDRRDRKIGGH
jgi:hypothetical protein